MDDFRGAFKCSEITVGGVAKEVFKEINKNEWIRKFEVSTSDVAVASLLLHVHITTIFTLVKAVHCPVDLVIILQVLSTPIRSFAAGPNH